MLKEVEKVLAYITRFYEVKTQILVFEQMGRPEAGIQVPAGSVDPNESMEAALLREVREESGLSDDYTVRHLGRVKWFRKDRDELHQRNVYEIQFKIMLKEK